MKRLALSIAIIVVFILAGSAFSYLGPPNKNNQSPHFIAELNDVQAQEWVDSVYRTLNLEERIAQLISVRAHSNLGASHINNIKALIRKYKIGSLTFFQGSPVKQAELTNQYQALSKVPLLIAIDGEWGLGMRLDSVISLPHQMMMGAIKDSALIFEVGKLIGEQCKRLGVQIDFAPDVDINNNPNNPVINDRSFGEDKKTVARWGVQLMKGMQSTGTMAVAKHFPGHGDTDQDSHKTLPTISKSLDQLKQVELYPFQQMINNGVAGVMVGHLEIPAIDSRPHRPMSISDKAIHGLLRNEMGYNGLVFTDALEMKGVSGYYKNGSAALEALKADNDVLLLPENVGEAIQAIKRAVEAGEVSKKVISEKAKKILMAKYRSGLNQWKPIKTHHLTSDLNNGVLALTKKLSDAAITVLNNDNHLLPFSVEDHSKILLLHVGRPLSIFSKEVAARHNVDLLAFGAKNDFNAASNLAKTIVGKYDKVIISIGNYHRYPAGKYGISDAEISLVQELQEEMRAVTIAFGNPYAIQYFSEGAATIAAYNSSVTMQRTAAALLFGDLEPQGRLPVSVSPEFPAGTGLSNFTFKTAYLPFAVPSQLGIESDKLKDVDSLALLAISKKATPGMVILAMKDGKIFYQKSFGDLDYNDQQPVKKNTIYDMASVTKVAATTMACMKLYDEGKLDLNATVGHYLPWTRGSNKENITIKDVMLHQARLIPDFSINSFLTKGERLPKPEQFHSERDNHYTVHVANNLYLRSDYLDTVKSLIIDSRLLNSKKYVYSDVSFQLMGYIVETITGLPLEEYVKKALYNPMGLLTTGFKPLKRFPLAEIAPTECEKGYRQQCLHGNVHDPRAALTGGVAGHAGLFSDAYDLAALLQMTLNGGSFAGIQYLKPETIQLFTSYQSDLKDSRRGLGWDKPAKDQSKFHSYPYPAHYPSPETYGHTGYTGTAVWVDPKYHFVFVFLSNRVNPDGGTNTNLYKLETRGRILDTFYEAMGVRS